jgi:hypothetical protein
MIKPRFQSLLERLSKITPHAWILLGFFISYLLFFVRPIFLSSQYMQFPEYVPAKGFIGEDLLQMLSYSESWFIAKQTPYIDRNLYPPLASVLFTPLLGFEFSVAYKIVTLVNVLFYGLMTFVLPLRIGKERQGSSLLMLIFITGLFSYGFQFELERGQFNVITMAACLLAIWIYHNHHRFRFLAYILFTISIQLKVFPAIFIVMFITNWHDWKNNIKRFVGLGIVNFALFFILGPSVFVDFLRAIKAQSVNPSIWNGNHSIRSFVTSISNTASQNGWTWINHYSGWVQLAFLAMIAICLFLIMRKAYQQNQTGVNSFLLLACTIGALLIPPVSHDYKLSILAAPVAILLSDISSNHETDGISRHRFFPMMMIFIFSAAYSTTLFSYTNKPPLLASNFPALMFMLLITTCLSVIDRIKLISKVSETEETA